MPHILGIYGHELAHLIRRDSVCPRAYLDSKKLIQRLTYIMKWAQAQAYFSGGNPVELAELTLR